MLDCGQEALEMSKVTFEVFEKDVNDYVTSVDQTLDKKLSLAFEKWFPNDGIITEENYSSRRCFHQNYPRIWFIDPIDGTDDFIQRRSNYSIMVGLLTDYYPQAGWVYAPAHNYFVWGGPDWGLFAQYGEGDIGFLPVKPLKFGSLCPIMIGDKDKRRFGQAILSAFNEWFPQASTKAEFQSLGSFGLKVIEVIKGNAGLYVYLNGRVKLWDTTGPIALANAAGLVCCDLYGHSLRFDEAAINTETLAHQQAIIIGWPDYVEKLLPVIQQAVSNVLS
jgi:3'(2'), 5'-bisphosphate nucleotidase